MKKAQFEIIGLAIIVIIVMVGIFFLLSFNLKPTTNPAGEFQQEQFAQNVLDAMMKTSLPDECPGTISDVIAANLLEEWPTGVNPNSICAPPPPGESYAYRLEQLVEVTLKKAINEYSGRSYYLSIFSDECPIADHDPNIQCWGWRTENNKGEPCFPREQGSYRAGHQIISLYPHGNAEIKLQICKS